MLVFELGVICAELDWVESCWRQRVELVRCLLMDVGVLEQLRRELPDNLIYTTSPAR